MMDWWNSLALEYQVFYGIGILSLLVVATQMLLTLVGFDADGGLDGGNFGDLDGASGIGLFSTQTIAAFFLGFGWTGVAALKSGLSIWLAGVGAFVAGVCAMVAMYYMLRALLSLQSKGNLEYSTAVGEEATVYVTIPGENADGGGQIQLTIQGRHTTATARKLTPGPLKPGTPVRVVGMASPTSFIVEALEPLHTSQHHISTWKS